MQRFAALALACLLPLSGTLAAQTYQQPAYGNAYAAPVQYDTARIVNVVPVAGTSGYQGQNCYSSQGGYVPVGADPYGNGYYGNPGFNNGYGNNGYGQSNTGRVMAGVIGTVLGAAVGSQVGGGSGRYVTSALGSAVGNMAGQAVYENMQRNQRRGSVTVCDPNTGYGQGAMYDVTYLYNGRTYTTRLPYRPQGDSLQIQVSVAPR